MVKKSQTYYWTNKWQEGIKESEEALERGEFEVFNNIGEATRSFTRDKKSNRKSVCHSPDLIGESMVFM